MKKIASLLLVMIFCIGMTVTISGCGTPSPTETATTFLDALKARDSEVVDTVYAEKDISILNDVLGNNVDSEDESILSNEEFEKLLADTILDFDYEITAEEINGEKASVTVKIATYPMGEAFTNSYTDIMSEIWTLAFLEEAQQEEMMKSIFLKRWNEMDEKSYSGTAKLYLSKIEKSWIVDSLENNDEFTNALTGNLLNTLESMDFDEE